MGYKRLISFRALLDVTMTVLTEVSLWFLLPVCGVQCMCLTPLFYLKNFSIKRCLLYQIQTTCMGWCVLKMLSTLLWEELHWLSSSSLFPGLCACYVLTLILFPVCPLYGATTPKELHCSSEAHYFKSSPAMQVCWGLWVMHSSIEAALLVSS